MSESEHKEPGHINPEGERTEEYLVNNPEEITQEDLEKNRISLNNFWMKISQRNRMTHSGNGERIKLTEDIKSLVEEPEFDLAVLENLTSQINKYRHEFADIVNSETGNSERQREIFKELETLKLKREALILPIYKKLRTMGYKHYPDLVA